MASQQRKSTRRGFLKQSAAVGRRLLGRRRHRRASSARPTSNSRSPRSASPAARAAATSATPRGFGKIYAAVRHRPALARRRRPSSSRPSNKFTDYREMLDKLGDKIDVVVDQHARSHARRDRRQGHEDGQARLRAEAADAHDLGSPRAGKDRRARRASSRRWATSSPPTSRCARPRTAFARARSARSRKCHVWTNRPIWAAGRSDRPPRRPCRRKSIGSRGSARRRCAPTPTAPTTTSSWRGWWDFGTGSLGDMACHTCNLPFMALNMRNPTAVEGHELGHNHDSYPATSKIKFEFPELDGRPAFTLHWSDKSQLPPEELYAEFLEKPGRRRQAAAALRQRLPDRRRQVHDVRRRRLRRGRHRAERRRRVDRRRLPEAAARVGRLRACERSHVKEFYNAIHDPQQEGRCRTSPTTPAR